MEFSKLLKYLASSSVHMITEQFDILFNSLHQKLKRRKESIFMGTLSYGRSHIIYKH